MKRIFFIYIFLLFVISQAWSMDQKPCKELPSSFRSLLLTAAVKCSGIELATEKNIVQNKQNFEEKEIRLASVIKCKAGLSYLAPSPDGKKIAYRTSPDHSFGIWDFGQAKCELFFLQNPNDQGIVWSLDGKKIIRLVGSTLAILDVATGTQHDINMANRRDFGIMVGMELSHDERHLAVGTFFKNNIGILNPTTGELEHHLSGEPLKVAALAGWSKDDRYFAAASGKGMVKVWETDYWNVAKECKIHDKEITRLVWFPNRPMLASTSHDNTIVVWNLQNIEKKFQIDCKEGISYLQCLSDHELIFCQDKSCITILDIATGNKKSINGCWPITVLPGGKAFAFGRDNTYIQLADFCYPQEPCSLGPNLVEAGLLLGFLEQVAFFIAGKNPEVPIVQSDNCMLDVMGNLEHTGDIRHLAVCPNGQKMASISSLSNQVRISERSTGKSKLFQSNSGHISGAAFFAGGNKVIIVTTDGGIEVLDSETGQKNCARFDNDQFSGSLSYPILAPNEDRLAVSSTANKILIIKTAELQLEHELQGFVSALAGWSPDGARFAAAYHDGTVKLWNAQNWELLEEKKIHDKAITSLVWSPDGTCLASASRDNTVARWNGQEELEKMDIDPRVLFPAVVWLSKHDLAFTSPQNFITRLNFNKKAIEVVKGAAPITSTPDGRKIFYCLDSAAGSQSRDQYIRIAELRSVK